MTDVFEVLRQDHIEVRQMLKELEAGSGAAAVTEQDALDLRTKMVEQLVIEESKHEAVEEEYFWPAVRELLPDGDTLADQAVEQEQAAKQVLNDLIGLKAGDQRFEDLVWRFISDGRAHITFEEEQVWPEFRKVLSPERAQELGDKLLQAKKHAPTRPHPHTPPKPGVLKTAGPAVAAADKLRDTVTGRDKD
jgi:hemerythrin superfamily protein